MNDITEQSTTDIHPDVVIPTTTAPARVPAVPTQTLNPMQLVQMAVEQNVDLNKLERLMDLERNWRADNARDAYVKAMAKFRAETITIVKTKTVNYESQGQAGGRVQYRFAPLNVVLDAAVPPLSKHGLSHSWSTIQNGPEIAVTCTLRHKDGHSESTTLSATPDDTGKKNKIQAIGSTVSYLERYTFLALTGLAAGEQDDDGKGADPVPSVSTEQAVMIRVLIQETGADPDAFLEWIGATAVAHIPASEFDRCVSTLNRKANKTDNPRSQS